MTAAISQGEYPDEDAWKGLALLRLMAEAADDKGPNWVNRRVEQLEFLDERAVRWRVSVDFYVPDGAADGYHYGDTHGWTNDRQGVLAGMLQNAEKAAFRSAALKASGGRDPARSLRDGAGS